jgi:hypothetical protein
MILIQGIGDIRRNRENKRRDKEGNVKERHQIGTGYYTMHGEDRG